MTIQQITEQNTWRGDAYFRFAAFFLLHNTFTVVANSRWPWLAETYNGNGWSDPRGGALGVDPVVRTPMGLKARWAEWENILRARHAARERGEGEFGT